MSAARFLLCFILLTLAGCTAAPVRSPLAQWEPSPNQNARGPILVVLHFTSQDSVEQSLRTLSTRNSGGKVSAHYLIGRDGRIYQLVSEDRRAWHAGPGRWGTITDVNSASIGIELDNDGVTPYPTAQIEALLRLLGDVCERNDIPRSQVIGHSDMAPARKIDPGPLFPWQALAAAGFGVWPVDAGDPPLDFDAPAALDRLGYPMADPAAAIRAFHLRFRARADLPNALDAEDARILHGLLPRLNQPAPPRLQPR